MEKHIKAIIQALGEDPAREGLRDTPKRAARALAFLTQGYKAKLDDIVNGAIYQTVNDEMVIVRTPASATPPRFWFRQVVTTRRSSSS